MSKKEAFLLIPFTKIKNTKIEQSSFTRENRNPGQKSLISSFYS